MTTIIAQRAWFQRIAFTNKGNVMTHEEALNLIEQAKHHLFLAETAYDEYKSSKFSGSDSYTDMGSGLDMPHLNMSRLMIWGRTKLNFMLPMVITTSEPAESCAVHSFIVHFGTVDSTQTIVSPVPKVKQLTVSTDLASASKPRIPMVVSIHQQDKSYLRKRSVAPTQARPATSI
jgi:hypothetical protein